MHELGRDLTLTLLKVIEATEIPTTYDTMTSQEQIVKASIMNLIMLQRIYPDVLKELKELAIDYNERLKQQAIPLLFKASKNGKMEVNEESISFMFKYNMLMS